MPDAPKSPTQVRKREPGAKVVDDALARMPVRRGILCLLHVPEARSCMAPQGQGKAGPGAIVLRQAIGGGAGTVGLLPVGWGTWRANSYR